MSEKSQTIGDFAFCRPSQILPIYRIIARSLSQYNTVLNKVLHGEALPQVLRPYHLYAFA